MTATTSGSAFAVGDDERLVRLLDDVVQTLNPLAIYLFGSRAEGRASPTSDYDLVVILPDDAPEEALDVVKASAAGRRAKVPADIIPTTREVFLACRGNLSTLEGVAQARGVLVYGSPVFKQHRCQVA
jgi:predicted nucleotidyltransferase